MAVYLVERDLKGFTRENLASAQKAAIATAADMTDEGEEISYIRSTFAPEDGRCMCLFECKDLDQVRRLNDTAGLPYARLMEVIELTP